MVYKLILLFKLFNYKNREQGQNVFSISLTLYIYYIMNFTIFQIHRCLFFRIDKIHSQMFQEQIFGGRIFECRSTP